MEKNGEEWEENTKCEEQTDVEGSKEVMKIEASKKRKRDKDDEEEASKLNKIQRVQAEQSSQVYVTEKYGVGGNECEFESDIQTSANGDGLPAKKVDRSDRQDSEIVRSPRLKN